MSDYNGNFYSGAYNPEYNVKKLTGIVKSRTVTAAEVTATKVVLYTGVTEDVANLGVIAIITRGTVALATNYTIDKTVSGSNTDINIKGNGNYTLTAGDVITYIVLPTA